MKNLSKNLVTALMIATSFSSAISVLSPRAAHAYILVDVGSGYDDINHINLFGSYPTNNILAVGLCVLILPFCVLDEKVSSSAAVSSTDLAANGYSPVDVQKIQSDQAVLIQRLKDAHAILQVRDTDTSASFQKDIRSLYPEVSQTYLEFATSAASLK